MTPEQQRIAIAEACGIAKCPVCSKHHLIPTKGHPVVPDYLSDLNAMHDAEKSLDAFQFDDYRKQLAKPWATCEDDGMWAAISATASQRAEAFLRTLNYLEILSTLPEEPTPADPVPEPLEPPTEILGKSD